MATYALRDEVNLSSNFVGPDINELEMAGLTSTPAQMVKPPRVAESPVHMECRWFTTLTLPANSPSHNSSLVIGKVVGIHIDDQYLTDEGKVDVVKIRPLARMGYYDYTSVDSIFTMPPLDEGELAKRRRVGLVGEASAKKD
mgnify:FL=1